MGSVQHSEHEIGRPRRRGEQVTAKLTHCMRRECVCEIHLEPLVLRDAPGANLALPVGLFEEFAEFTVGNRVAGPRAVHEQDVDVVDVQRRQTRIQAACRDGRVVHPGALVRLLTPLDGAPQRGRFAEQRPSGSLEPAEPPSHAADVDAELGGNSHGVAIDGAQERPELRLCHPQAIHPRGVEVGDPVVHGATQDGHPLLSGRRLHQSAASETDRADLQLRSAELNLLQRRGSRKFGEARRR